MNGAIDRVAYYRDLIRRNQMEFLESKSQEDKQILRQQINTFQRLRLRYMTIHLQEISKRNQTALFENPRQNENSDN